MEPYQKVLRDAEWQYQPCPSFNSIHHAKSSTLRRVHSKVSQVSVSGSTKISSIQSSDLIIYLAQIHIKLEYLYSQAYWPNTDMRLHFCNSFKTPEDSPHRDFSVSFDIFRTSGLIVRDLWKCPKLIANKLQSQNDDARTEPKLYYVIQERVYIDQLINLI